MAWHRTNGFELRLAEAPSKFFADLTAYAQKRRDAVERLLDDLSSLRRAAATKALDETDEMTDLILEAADSLAPLLQYAWYGQPDEGMILLDKALQALAQNQPDEACRHLGILLKLNPSEERQSSDDLDQIYDAAIPLLWLAQAGWPADGN